MARLKTLSIKDAVCLFLVGVAFACLLIDSRILAAGAARWAESPIDRISFSIVAFIMPWVVAVTPFVVIMLWRTRHFIWAIVACFVWCVLVTYNVIGAGGAIAMIRSDVIAVRKHDATIHGADLDTRENLAAQRKNAMANNPRQVSALRPLIEQQKASPWWGYSDGCKDVSKPKERKFCTAYQALVSELGAAEALVSLTAKIEAIDAKMQAAGAVSDDVDPAARFVAAWTPVSAATAQSLLPLGTPIVLLMISITMLGIVLAMQDSSHGALLGAMTGNSEIRKPRIDSAISASRGKPLLAVASRGKDAVITRQREMAVWFFQECARPLTEGSMLESDWYRHYQDFCRAANDTPMTIASFREIAGRVEFLEIAEVAGHVRYFGALPLVPTKVASAS